MLTITLSPVEMQVVWNAMMEGPGKHTYEILKKLEHQLTQQGAFGQPAIPKEAANEAPSNTGG